MMNMMIVEIDARQIGVVRNAVVSDLSTSAHGRTDFHPLGLRCGGLSDRDFR